MSRSNLLTSADVSEYDRIEMAMSESDRGRWFLTEFARRNRGADTQSVLGAIARLESVVTQGRDESQIGGQVGRMRGDLMDMANAIARTKAEIAALGTPEHESSRLGGASLALDAIVRSTERATSDILSAAEDVQETAWTLRETGSDAAMCDTLDQRATQIYTACSFQDLTAQRTARIIHTLRYLEERVGSMMAIWGDALDTVPPAPDATTTAAPIDLSQSDVDRFIEDGPVATASVAEQATAAAEPEASAAPTAALALAAPEATAEMQTAEATEEADAVPDSAPTDAMEQSEAAVEADIATAFADIDSLTEEEKRALFS